MPDDRELRDELEKVQSEVLRLKRGFKHHGLYADVRARIESLRRSKQQQQQKLDDALAEIASLEQQARAVMAANEKLQAELYDLARREGALVSATVHSLDPGPRSGTGCLTALAVAASALALGACW